MYWQETRPAVTLGASSLPYTVTVLTDTNLIQIMSASISGQPLGPTTLDELDNRVYNWRSKTGKPQSYYQPNPNQLALYPIPDGTDTYDVVLRVSWTPTRASTTVIDYVYEYYLEEIAAALYFRGLFNNGMQEAAIEATRSYTRGAQHIQMRA
jgi:hypothetical protein